MSRNCNPRLSDSTGTERQAGQTMAEYGVVLAVITLAVVAAFAPLLADAIVGAVDRVVDILAGVTG